MASTYSDRLKLELMATGANANTWGTNTNNNLEVVDAFAAGYLSKSVAGSSNITLTTSNASDTAESSNKTIELTGALTGDIVVFIPAVESEYNFFNNTTGSQTLTIAATGHTANGVVIAQSAKTTVFCDGASNYNVEIISSTDAGALGSGTLADARFPATLPAISGANLTNLDASDLASGTVPDARFPATLPQVSGANLTNLNASNVASGTLATARLPTVPTTKGGTGLTSLGSAGQVLTVANPGSALEFADGGGGGGYNATVYTGPATYNPPADLHSVKITCVGAGGRGGNGSNGGSGGGGGAGGYAVDYVAVASIPGPVSITAGAGASGTTSSFGGFVSATAGANGQDTNPSFSAPGSKGSSGSGSGGILNASGQIDPATLGGERLSLGYDTTVTGDQHPLFGGGGGSFPYGVSSGAGQPGGTYGGGGGGGKNNAGSGGSGGAGFVMVEEFFG